MSSLMLPSYSEPLETLEDLLDNKKVILPNLSLQYWIDWTREHSPLGEVSLYYGWCIQFDKFGLNYIRTYTFSFLVKSNLPKLETSHTVMLPPMVSVLWIEHNNTSYCSTCYAFLGIRSLCNHVTKYYTLCYLNKILYFDAKPRYEPFDDAMFLWLLLKMDSSF